MGRSQMQFNWIPRCQATASARKAANQAIEAMTKDYIARVVKRGLT